MQTTLSKVTIYLLSTSYVPDGKGVTEEMEGNELGMVLALWRHAV